MGETWPKNSFQQWGGGSTADILEPILKNDKLKFLWVKEQTSMDPAKDNN